MSVQASASRARAWIVARADGVTLGFTDHDLPLTVLGVACRAGSGFTPSAWSEEAPGGSDMDIIGALQDDVIEGPDIEGGLYDDAEVAMYWVDWTGVYPPRLVHASRIGEVRRESSGRYVATLVGYGSRATLAKGTVISAQCQLEFGGAVSGRTGRGCGYDLTQESARGTGTVSFLDTDRRFELTGLTLASLSAIHGSLRWVTGANVGHRAEIREHDVVAGVTAVTLVHAPARPIAVGDEAEITIGCDRSHSRCVQLGNAARFGAFFPPPEDDVVRYTDPAQT
jgi:uncharacterized phage protein (TIGR02218 family)